MARGEGQDGTGPDDDSWEAWQAPDSWTAGDTEEEDDDVEVFVFTSDADTLTPADGDDLPFTLTSEDVAGDDWNDASWLAALDDPLPEPGPAATHGAPGPSTAAPDAPYATDGGTPPTTHAGTSPNGFVLDARAGIAVEASRDPREDAAQVLADASAATPGGDHEESDVAGLLRELSLLSVDD